MATITASTRKKAVQLAVRDQLRTGWAPNATNVIPASMVNVLIKDTADEKPPPGLAAPPKSCFVAVVKGNRSSDQHHSLDEQYGCSISLTKWFTGPFDRINETVLAEATDGLDDISDSISAFLHMNYNVLNAANVYIQNAATNASLASVYGFAEPLAFIPGDELARMVFADHFHADPGSEMCGVVLTLRFGGMRLLQSIQLMQ